MENSYKLPDTVRMRVIWALRDFERIQKTGTEQAQKEKEIIGQAMEAVPEEYRMGVWNSAVHRQRYPEGASKSTYKRKKRKFYYQIAKGFNLIEGEKEGNDEN